MADQIPLLADTDEFTKYGFGDFTFLQRTFVDVWKATEVSTSRSVILKCVVETDENQAAQQLLCHEQNVLSLVDGNRFPTRIELDEQCSFRAFAISGMPLLKRIKTRGPLGLATAIMALRQCLEMLKQLESAGFSHGSISPDSIWITDGGTIQIAHLESATLISEPAAMSAIANDRPNWLAPGCFSGNTSPQEADLFSVGVLFLEMLGISTKPSDLLPGIALVRRGEVSEHIAAARLSTELADYVDQLLTPTNDEVNFDALIRQLIEIELDTMTVRFQVAA
ncbi:MAG: hypothetical protein CMJ78_09840 [Planctomycetaceae bacterium]|nr:hypothetical protein [Planctomycetaceae bacterium]